MWGRRDNAHLWVLCRGIGVTIACPGPVATGSADAPRNVFSSTGLVAKHEPRGGGVKRLAPGRVAQLIARAAYKCGPSLKPFSCMLA